MKEPVLNTNQLYQMVELISKEKNINPQVIVAALEEAMATAAKKYYSTQEDLRARFSRETGSVEVYALKTVVDDVEDEDLQISLEEARDIDESFEVDDKIEIPMDTSELGRISVQTVKQIIIQKVREAERKNIYTEFNTKLGLLVSGVLKRFERDDMILDLGKTEAVLKAKKISRQESFKIGDRVRCVIHRVHENASKGPQVEVSRTDTEFVTKLFETEIPEIYDGTVLIKRVVREPGERSKVAVMTMDRNVDPVGACVGMKGNRINAIIRELRGEKIDVVPWSSDITVFASNALSPARPTRVRVVDEDRKILEVVVDNSQLSLAIGKGGQNVHLATDLVEWNISIKSEEEKRQEMEDETRRLAALNTSVRQLQGLEEPIIESLIASGIHTIGDLIETEEEELASIPGVSEQTVERIVGAVEQLMAPFESGKDASSKEKAAGDASAEAQEAVAEETPEE